MLQEAEEKFDLAIATVRDSKNSPFQNGMDLLNSGSRRFSSTSPDQRIPEFSTITGLYINDEPAPEGGTAIQIGILVREQQLLHAQVPVIAGDLVRTVSLMNLYPDKGFERPYRQSYADALGAQRRWLMDNNYPPVEFDPRYNSRDKILPAVMGQDRFLFEAGFSHWQDEVRKKRADKENSKEMLDELYSNVLLFVVRRERTLIIARKAEQKVLEELGRNYRVLGKTQRAEGQALSLVNISIAEYKMQDET